MKEEAKAKLNLLILTAILLFLTGEWGTVTVKKLHNV